MSTRDYAGPGVIYYNGSVLAEAQSIRVRFISNNNRVRTMKRGLAGRSRGPRETEVSVSNAVPQEGIERDYINDLLADRSVRLGFKVANRTVQSDGWTDGADWEAGTDTPQSFSFDFVGGPAQVI
jgi:hypothetical protein